RYAPQAEHVPVGRHEPGKVAETHAAIDRRIVEEAAAGRCVVRLKGGDPLVFGRTAQELAVAREHGIPCSIVPGVTSACAAAAEEEFPLTARGTAGAVVFVTGHRMHGVPEPRWDLLARCNETIVVYMGAARAAEIAKRLIDGGRSPAEPTAIVHAASRSERRVRYQRLHELIDGAAEPACKPPCVIVIGPVVRLGKSCPVELGGTVSIGPRNASLVSERRVDA
ncbi:MAG: uroporphyrinogen-III C-methyltransferase, partial [Planctomycetota bacterium]